MESKKLVAIGLITVGLLAAGVVILNPQDRSQAESDEGNFEANNSGFNTSGDFKTTEDGTRYIVHPDKLRQGCPSMDCIPSIDDPKYEHAAEADWMEPGDQILAVEREQESKAFPLKIMDVHEIVNTEIDGEPIVVTYCPLCRSGVTYSREVNGETLEFGVSGKLRNANLVMYDRSTKSYWSQIGGKAIIGPRTGQELQLRYSSITNWSSWRKGHPETKVLSQDTDIYPASRYRGRAYSGYDSPRGFGVDEVDSRLDEMELVRGIKVNGTAKAYPESNIKSEELIQDEVGGVPVAVLHRPDDGTVIAFERRIRNRKVNLNLTEDILRDSRGNKWSFNGEEIDGDRKLRVIDPQGFYWFAWSKFHPGTEVYTG